MFILAHHDGMHQCSNKGTISVPKPLYEERKTIYEREETIWQTMLVQFLVSGLSQNSSQVIKDHCLLMALQYLGFLQGISMMSFQRFCKGCPECRVVCLFCVVDFTSARWQLLRAPNSSLVTFLKLHSNQGLQRWKASGLTNWNQEPIIIQVFIRIFLLQKPCLQFIAFPRLLSATFGHFTKSFGIH